MLDKHWQETGAEHEKLREERDECQIEVDAASGSVDVLKKEETDAKALDANMSEATARELTFRDQCRALARRLTAAKKELEKAKKRIGDLVEEHKRRQERQVRPSIETAVEVLRKVQVEARRIQQKLTEIERNE